MNRLHILSLTQVHGPSWARLHNMAVSSPMLYHWTRGDRHNSSGRIWTYASCKIHHQYHGFWWPEDTRSQVISSHGIELVLMEYSGLNMSIQLILHQTSKHFHCDHAQFFIYICRKSLGDRLSTGADSGVIHQSGSARGAMELTFKLKKVCDSSSCRKQKNIFAFSVISQQR